MTTTFDGLRDIIVRDFELPAERLARDTPLEEIDLDSLAVTELVFALEDEFHVTADHAVPAFVKLGDIADYIDRLIADRAANGLPSGAAANGRDVPSVPSSAKSIAKKGGKPARSATEGTGDSLAPPSRKPAGRAPRKPPARASATRGAAGAAQPRTPETPKRRRSTDNARSDGRAR